MSIEMMGDPPLRVVAERFVEAALRGRVVSRTRVVYAPARVEAYARVLRLHVLETGDARYRCRVGDVPVNRVDARVLQGLS